MRPNCSFLCVFVSLLLAHMSVTIMVSQLPAIRDASTLNYQRRMSENLDQRCAPADLQHAK